jgi:hypothetical protein
MDLSISQQLEKLENNGTASHRQLLSLFYLVMAAGLFVASIYSSNLGLFIASILMLWVRHNELEAITHFCDACKSLHDYEPVECEVEISEYSDEICGHHYCVHVMGPESVFLCKFEFSPEGWQPELGHDKVRAYFLSTSHCPTLMISTKGLIIPT